jgi:hypothetical protein
VLATALSTLHLAAVGVWVFAIAASVSARQGAPRALRLFSPYAIGSAAVVAVTGVCNAAFELGAANDLLSTGYGKTLLAKGVAFVAMAGLGFLHYTRRRRRAEPARLVRPLRAEAVAAAVAVTLAAVLVAFPTPPRESEAAARLTSADPLLASLPGRPALSVAGASGPFVVTLTILPPSPGEVRLHVSVLGVQAGDGLRHARVVGSSSRGRRLNVALGPCGLGCFEGRAAITAGAWRLETRITTNRGPATLTLHVPLPTPGGAPELRRSIAAMDGLHTARMLETLRSSARGRAVVSHYAYRAPDAFRVAVAGGTTRIVIGRAEFDRPQSARAWTKTPWPGSPFTWPRSYYASLWDGAAAARVLGRQQLHGRRTEIVAFVRPNLPAWFRLWVGVADGVVYREQMLAEGHIMNHRYRPNAPVAIRRPRRES